ncbi:MAG: GNAT family N-acyltransferase, partial [Halioglobus sp.]|nr:GNAT family N-acyltransferase [Halioglobus sp.]
MSENFLRYFDVVYAGSADLMQEVYGIRYRVYCEEFKYEPSVAFPDKQEKDEYDESSLHALILHKSSGLAAGCVRMVSAAPNDEPLPFEKNC